MRQRLEYLAVVIARAVTAVMPYPLLWLSGTAVVYLFYVFDRTHRRVAAENLAAAFPRRSRAERHAIVLTTDKDAVRLPEESVSKMPLASVPLVSTIEPADEFRAWLLGQIR